MGERNLRVLQPLESEQNSYSVIAVGNVKEWAKIGLLSTENIMFLSFHEISRATMELYTPEFIVSPVLSGEFDCIDLAQLLDSIEFAGAYRAVGSNLPRPGMIEREIASLCPRLDFAILRSNQRKSLHDF